MAMPMAEEEEEEEGVEGEGESCARREEGFRVHREGERRETRRCAACGSADGGGGGGGWKMRRLGREDDIWEGSVTDSNWNCELTKNVFRGMRLD